jgi:ParB/RepB/Spo0J family partition protein
MDTGSEVEELDATEEVEELETMAEVAELETAEEAEETEAAEATTEQPQATKPAKEPKRLRDLRSSMRDQIMFDPRIIVVEDGHNPRDYTIPENRAHLDDLKASIRENGTISPLWIRWDAENRAAVLVDGECRLRANLELIAEGVEIEAVPCIQVPGGKEQDRLLLAIVANQNKPLSELELGAAFRKLYAFGWSEEKIAKKSGKPVAFVRRSMELNDAPEAVQEMVRQQEVTPALAISEVRQNGAAAVETLRAKAKAAKASGKKTAKKTKKANTSVINLAPAVRKMLKDIPVEDLKNPDNEWISVSRVKLVAIAGLLS